MQLGVVYNPLISRHKVVEQPWARSTRGQKNSSFLHSIRPWQAGTPQEAAVKDVTSLQAILSRLLNSSQPRVVGAHAPAYNRPRNLSKLDGCAMSEEHTTVVVQRHLDELAEDSSAEPL